MSFESYYSASEYKFPRPYMSSANANGSQKKKAGFYAVARGRLPGIYKSW